MGCELVAMLLMLVSQTGQTKAPAPCSIRLTDVTSQTKIAFRHTDGGSGQRYIVESVVAGLAMLDYDNDGQLDIYLLNGTPLKGTKVEVPPRNALYRNNGDWTFTDVSLDAGVAEAGYGLGVTAADFDNDGDEDLYLNNFGPNVLFVNNGDGTFSRGGDAAGVNYGEHVGAGACFLDMDADGDLDLYAANYVDFTYEKHIVRMIGTHQFHPGPNDYHPVPDKLFRNNADGTFTDVTESSGVGSVAGPGMGTVSFDYDDDGDPDVFVCNDAKPNFLFQNDGRGNFTETGELAGVAYNYMGRTVSSMGADCGDYDNDGRLDLFVTDFSAEMPVLFRNLGNGSFQDVTNSTGAGRSAYPHVTWGNGFIDFDADGDRDLFIACGHFMDNIRYIDDRTAVKVPNILLMNDGRGRFLDVSTQCGSALAVVESSRGVAFGDLDNDGDCDGVVLNANGPVTAMRNDTETTNHWVQLRLIGTISNRDAVGARVRVQSEGRWQVAEVHSGRSYQSHFGMQLHFGIGKSQRIDRVEVRWPGGATQVFENLAADHSYVLQQR